MNKTKFMQLYKDGKLTIDHIDDYIDEWHKSNDNGTLHEYLGMSFDEYNKYIKGEL